MEVQALTLTPRLEYLNWPGHIVFQYQRRTTNCCSCRDCKAVTGDTHKLRALEQIAVVRVCCRVLSHKAKDFGRGRQDGTEGDGGQRACVQQKLKTGRTGDDSRPETARRVIELCAFLEWDDDTFLWHTLVLLSKMSTPLSDTKRWTLPFLATFSEEYLSGILGWEGIDGVSRLSLHL